MPPLSRILIVDDNADHRLILTYQLARIGPFEIHETGDGQQALVVIATTPPDLIFMNLGLPLLRRWGRYPSLPIRPMPRGGKSNGRAKRAVMSIWSSRCEIGGYCGRP